MIKEFKTRTGAIYCDTEKKMEYLYVGDYGKENNIKADFLGFKKEINSVPHHDVDLRDKMVVTISTQKGCPMKCMFCDCPKVKFGGNISREELAEEVSNSISYSGCKYTERFNLHPESIDFHKDIQGHYYTVIDVCCYTDWPEFEEYVKFVNHPYSEHGINLYKFIRSSLEKYKFPMENVFDCYDNGRFRYKLMEFKPNGGSTNFGELYENYV